MKSKFTAGPWRSTVSKSGRKQISGTNGQQIAALWNCKETCSNGLLIAAAPEMYEILIMVAEQDSQVGIEAKKLLNKINGGAE